MAATRHAADNAKLDFLENMTPAIIVAKEIKMRFKETAADVVELVYTTDLNQFECPMRKDRSRTAQKRGNL